MILPDCFCRGVAASVKPTVEVPSPRAQKSCAQKLGGVSDCAFVSRPSAVVVVVSSLHKGLEYKARQGQARFIGRYYPMVSYNHSCS